MTKIVLLLEWIVCGEDEPMMILSLLYNSAFVFAVVFSSSWDDESINSALSLSTGAQDTSTTTNLGHSAPAVRKPRKRPDARKELLSELSDSLLAIRDEMDSFHTLTQASSEDYQPRVIPMQRTPPIEIKWPRHRLCHDCGKEHRQNLPYRPLKEAPKKQVRRLPYNLQEDIKIAARERRRRRRRANE